MAALGHIRPEFADMVLSLDQQGRLYEKTIQNLTATASTLSMMQQLGGVTAEQVMDVIRPARIHSTQTLRSTRPGQVSGVAIGGRYEVYAPHTQEHVDLAHYTVPAPPDARQAQHHGLKTMHGAPGVVNEAAMFHNSPPGSDADILLHRLAAHGFTSDARSTPLWAAAIAYESQILDTLQQLVETVPELYEQLDQDMPGEPLTAYPRNGVDGAHVLDHWLRDASPRKESALFDGRPIVQLDGALHTNTPSYDMVTRSLDG